MAKPGNLGLAGTCSLRDGTPSQWRKEGGGIEKVFLRGPEAAGAHQRFLAAVLLRSDVNSELNFCPNFEGLVLGCIDADFCK